MRDSLNRSHVRGDIFANTTIATSRRLNKQSVLITNRHGEPVNLQLSNKPGRLLRFTQFVESTLKPCPPGNDLSRSERVVKAHHGNAMLNRREGNGRSSAYRLSGGIWGDEVGVLVLKPNEFAKKLIEISIGDLRRVLLVIKPIVMANGIT
ncbi:unannotated protein [freshwater metagenome]|uniref:Unannotated protein n=1 Tax=freshwater metagenome TaxID=449393 RepID=A0A6J7VLC3_9ZZZZ